RAAAEAVLRADAPDGWRSAHRRADPRRSCLRRLDQRRQELITRDIFAPGRSFRGCLGAFFIVIAVAALGCGRVESPESRALLELAGDTIELGRGAALADILVRSAATTTAVFEPDTIT